MTDVSDVTESLVFVNVGYGLKTDSDTSKLSSIFPRSFIAPNLKLLATDLGSKLWRKVFSIYHLRLMVFHQVIAFSIS